MIAVTDLIALFQKAYSEKWGYIWGASGQTWTEEKQKSATREMTVKYGSKWIGKRVADCSGLFYWAFKSLGESIYHGSNTIWNSYCSDKGKLSSGKRADGKQLKPGTAVFLYRSSDNNRHHIGLYVGNDTVIEAKGTIYGVVSSKLNHWDEWGKLKKIDYNDTENSVVNAENAMETIKNGSKGERVAELQSLLTKLGYEPGKIDGVFGKNTEQAVRAFQTQNGLNTDGIVGEKTWNKLNSATIETERLVTEEDSDALQRIESKLDKIILLLSRNATQEMK